MPRFGAYTVPYLKVLSGSGHYVFLPVLTTAQRNALSPAAGWVIYNSTTGQVEQYDGSGWEDVSNAAIATHAAILNAHTQNLLQTLRTGGYITTLLGSITTGASNANYLVVIPLVVARAITIDRIAIEVTTADAANPNLRLGIYKDGTNLYPGSLLLDAGVVSVATTGIKAITISQALTKGIYWLVYITDGAPSLRAVSQTSIKAPFLGHASTNFSWTLGDWYKNQTYGALPDPFPAGGTIDANNAVLIMVRVLSLD